MSFIGSYNNLYNYEDIIFTVKVLGKEVIKL